MTVQRTHIGHQTRYELRDAGVLSCVLTYGGAEIEPAVWKILLPGPDGTEDLYGTDRFLAPTAPPRSPARWTPHRRNPPAGYKTTAKPDKTNSSQATERCLLTRHVPPIRPTNHIP